jgi:broad specificity phosphatase PhoE
VDIALNETGVAQARSVAKQLAAVKIDAIYASPLQRAAETARPIAETHDQSSEPFEGLLDIDYGQWGGRSHKEVALKWPELYARWLTAPHLVKVPDGESLDDVRRRVLGGLNTILHLHDRGIVVLVGHQVVNKVLICALLGFENSAFWRIRQDTGCINRFDYDGRVCTVLTLNEVGHLPSHPAYLDLPPR